MERGGGSPMANWREKLAEARAALSDVRARIESYSYGDRPSSPPANLLREERRVRSIISWWEAEGQRVEGVRP